MPLPAVLGKDGIMGTPISPARHSYPACPIFEAECTSSAKAVPGGHYAEGMHDAQVGQLAVISCLTPRNYRRILPPMQWSLQN